MGKPTASGSKSTRSGKPFFHHAHPRKSNTVDFAGAHHGVFFFAFACVLAVVVALPGTIAGLFAVGCDGFIALLVGARGGTFPTEFVWQAYFTCTAFFWGMTRFGGAGVCAIFTSISNDTALAILPWFAFAPVAVGFGWTGAFGLGRGVGQVLGVGGLGGSVGIFFVFDEDSSATGAKQKKG